MKYTIILVTVGTFQDYIIHNVKQLLLLGYDVVIITEKHNFFNFNKIKNINLIDSNELDVYNFDAKSKLDKNYRNGFSHLCSKRLFLVYSYMKKYNKKYIIHLENDVLLYINFSIFNNFNKDKIYLTMDSKERCIPGIIYIPNSNVMINLIKNYDFQKNDMKNMSEFYYNNKDIVNTFPIIDDNIDKCIYNENFKEFNSIFDGAAMGQYLGGVDPRNIKGDTTGFVNETCIIKYNKYNFKWIKKGEYSFPNIEIKGKLIPINNLHIHCKDLTKFSI